MNDFFLYVLKAFLCFLCERFPPTLSHHLLYWLRWRLNVLEPFFSHRELVRRNMKWSIFRHIFFIISPPNWVRITFECSSGKINFILYNFASIRVRISSKKSRPSSRRKFAMERDVRRMNIAVRDLFAWMWTEVS